MLTVTAAALLATAAAVAPAPAGASADDGAAQAPDYAKLKSSLYELANSSLASVGGAMRKRAERLAGIQKPCDSGLPGDLPYTSCAASCHLALISSNAQAQCAKCKCRNCEVCAAPAAAAPAPKPQVAPPAS